MSNTAVIKQPIPLQKKLPAIPPLENGERLTRQEFERRYLAMPQIKKAELIEGVVLMPSPVHFASHGQPHAHIITWLGAYCAATPGVKMGDNATVRLDPDNEVQPDVLLRLAESKGGQSHISADDYLEGAPEMIVEIAASSASYDLYEKKTIYRRNGVQEYLIWQVYDGRIDWLFLNEGAYKPLEPDEQDILKSHIFPGLWLNGEALLRDDLAKVLATVQLGISTEGHQAFLTRLAQA